MTLDNVNVKAQRFDIEGGWTDVDEEVTGESPPTMCVNGSEFATVARNPWEIECMAVGFLCSEGILRLAVYIRPERVSQ